MNSPIINLMAVYADLCAEKKEIPYFNRNGLVAFLKKNKEGFHNVLRGIDFHPVYDSSEEVDAEMLNLIASGLMSSWGMDFNPHEVKKGIDYYFKKIPEKERDCLRGLAEKMYDELGCDERGIIGRHTSK